MRRRASQPEAALFTPNQTKLENRFSSNQSEDSVEHDRPTGFVSQVSQVRRIYFSLKPMVCLQKFRPTYIRQNPLLTNAKSVIHYTSDLLARGFTAARLNCTAAPGPLLCSSRIARPPSMSSRCGARPRNCRNPAYPSNNTKRNSCRRSDIAVQVGKLVGQKFSMGDIAYRR